MTRLGYQIPNCTCPDTGPDRLFEVINSYRNPAVLARTPPVGPIPILIGGGGERKTLRIPR